MRTVCAWCRRELSDDPPDADRPDSHGICEACIEEYFLEDTSLRGLLDPIEAPLAVTDGDMRVSTDGVELAPTPPLSR